MVQKSPSMHELESFQQLLERWAGFKITNSPATVRAREALLMELTHEHGFATVGELLDRLESDPESPLAWRVLGRATVGETHFFRHPPQFAQLETAVLPALVETRSKTTRRLTVWSAGCSTGEEPYSIAILLSRLIPDRSSWTITILGTDLSADALENARAGRYTRWSFRSTPQALIDRHFRRRGEEFAIDPSIRSMVRFARHNLLNCEQPPEPFVTGEIDLVLCRNVLIYFARPSVERVLRALSATLAPDGLLLTGPSETPLVTDLGLFRSVLMGSITFFGRPDRENGPPAARRTSGPIERPAPPTASPVAPPPPLDRPASPASAPRITGQVPVLAPRMQPPAAVVAAGPEAPAESLVARAWQAADRGELERCLDLVGKAIEEHGLDAEAYLLKGLVLADLGRAEEAIGALQRSLFLEWDLVLAHYHLGRLLVRAGDRARGLSHLRTVQSLVGRRSADEAIAHSELTCGRLLEQVVALASATDVAEGDDRS